MTMVVSRGQRIYFRFEGERGAYLLLHHGLFGSHQDWYRAGYVEALASEFRLVIPDARGHGRSDHPTAVDDYRQELLADDLVEIMNDLGIRNVHVLGYSLGALVGFALLRRHPERVRIAVLGGESPLVQPAQKELWAQQLARLRETSLTDHLASLREQQAVVRAEAEVDEAKAHPAACALLEAMQSWEPAPAERITVSSPLTLFAGAQDPALPRVEAARSAVTRARLVVFPGQTHAGLFAQREALSEELLRLLKSGRRQEEASDATGKEAGGAPRVPEAPPEPGSRHEGLGGRHAPRSGRMSPRGAGAEQGPGPEPAPSGQAPEQPQQHQPAQATPQAGPPAAVPSAPPGSAPEITGERPAEQPAPEPLPVVPPVPEGGLAATEEEQVCPPPSAPPEEAED